MVDHHVAQRADGIVEVPAILDAEVLRHRDLHALDVVAVPHRLQHPVGEPQKQDLLETHLPEVMIDPEELGLLHVLVQLLGQRPGRGVIVAERLLHHDPRGVRQPGLGKALDDRREQKRRDLEIEHRRRRALDRLTHARVGRRVGEIALHVRKPRREPLEHLRIELLARAENRLPGALDELLHTSSRRPPRPRSGHESRPSLSSRYSDRNVITRARSPVIPNTTSTSAACGVLGPLGFGVASTVIVNPSFVRHTRSKQPIQSFSHAIEDPTGERPISPNPGDSPG